MVGLRLPRPISHGPCAGSELVYVLAQGGQRRQGVPAHGGEGRLTPWVAVSDGGRGREGEWERRRVGGKECRHSYG